MTPDLKAQLAALEAEFASLDGPLQTNRQKWAALREQVRPLETEMAALEASADAIRHSPRYRELAEQLPHLRKAVGA